MNCQTARRLMESCRPSEADWRAPELAGVSAHLEECSDCLTEFRSRQSFDERVAAAMQSVAAPAGLREQIFARLACARVWRRRRVAVAWTAAAAAALVLAATGVNFWYGSAAGPVEIAKEPKALGEWAVATVDVHDDEENISVPTVSKGNQQAIEAWLRKRFRFEFALTVKWLPSSLQAIWQAHISGRPAAVLQFADSRGIADVFVFPHGRFDAGSASQAPQRIYATRGYVVVAWEEEDTTYVAVLRNWAPQDVRRLTGQPGGIT